MALLSQKPHNGNFAAFLPVSDDEYNIISYLKLYAAIARGAREAILQSMLCILLFTTTFVVDTCQLYRILR